MGASCHIHGDPLPKGMLLAQAQSKPECQEANDPAAEGEKPVFPAPPVGVTDTPSQRCPQQESAHSHNLAGFLPSPADLPITQVTLAGSPPNEPLTHTPASGTASVASPEMGLEQNFHP